MRLAKTETRPHGRGFLRGSMHGSLRACACLLSLACLHCVFDDRHAGTSTTVTNPVVAKTVTGEAILLDGTPAAGAEVSLRLPIVLVSQSGVPASKLVAQTVADDSGRFTLPMVFQQDVYMEIRESPAGAKSRNPDSQQVHLRRWPDGLPVGGKMGTFRMETPGSLTGSIATPDSTPGTSRWIGVRGTDNFKSAIGKAAFRLSAVPTGLRELEVVRVSDTAMSPTDTTRANMVSDSVSKAEVKSGQAADVGSIFYIID